MSLRARCQVPRCPNGVVDQGIFCRGHFGSLPDDLKERLRYAVQDTDAAEERHAAIQAIVRYWEDA